MGHEHLSTNQKYTHLSNPFIEDSLERYWSSSFLMGSVLVDKEPESQHYGRNFHFRFEDLCSEVSDILPPPMLRIEAGASRSSIPMNTVSAS